MRIPPPRRPASYAGASFELRVFPDSPILRPLEFKGVEIGSLKLSEIEHELSVMINAFIDARFYAEDQPIFRKEVVKFRDALSEFEKKIPDPTSSLSAALVETWIRQSRDNPNVGWTDARGIEPERQLVLQFHDANAFRVLKEALARLSDAVAGLASEERIGEKVGKSAARGEHEMVMALGHLYQRLTGAPPSLTTNPIGLDQRERAGGAFAEFVKAVEDELVRQRSAQLMTQKVVGDTIDTLRTATAKEAAAFTSVLRLGGHHHLIEAVVDRLSPRKMTD